MNKSGDQGLSIESWIAAARANPVERMRRQIVEILLTAIATTPSLREALIMKGGTLVSLAHQGLRTTSDVDFSTNSSNDILGAALDDLDAALERTAGRIGYPDLTLRPIGHS